MEAGRGASAGLADASGPILALLDAALVEHGRPDRPGTGARTRRRIVEHIEQRMDDPELDPRSIARSIGISRRYLHRLFRAGGHGEESISRYVVRRRLERCRDILSDPGQASRSVTEIALSGGFNSVSYFTTLFARAYGAPPARFRAATLSRRGRLPSS